VRLFPKQRSPGRLGLPSVAKRPFRLTTERDPQGKDFPSFTAARNYADCELAFGEAFVITHTPRGGTWHGQAGMRGEAFELPAASLEQTTYH
jgi:hypothetical protein